MTPVDERLAQLREAHPELRTSSAARFARGQLSRARGLDDQGDRVKPGPRQVRRLSAEQTGIAKRAFLEAHAAGWSVTASARAAGIDPNRVYEWKEHDEQFALACHQAEIQALHVLEDEAFRRAVHGNPYRRTSYWRGEPVGTDEKTEFSDALMTLLLRARAPERYGQKLDVTTSQVIKTVGNFDPAEVLGGVGHST